ncbi:MAG TPA: cupin domain-containing protein [Streptosporangiaceae bacterium]|nr:cupin domain-containing protein [Streptosporangiaceae bacterium]
MTDAIAAGQHTPASPASPASPAAPAAPAAPAVWRAAAGDGDAYWFFDSLMVVRSRQPGWPVIIEATVAPGGGAPLHVHADLDDSFYLVSGQLAMRCGDETFAVEPGAYVALPHGVPHTFRVVGDQPAVMLQVHADDSFLTFVKAVGQPAAGRTLPADASAMDMDAALKIAAQTGQPVVGPPMTDEEAALITGIPSP